MKKYIGAILAASILLTACGGPAYTLTPGPRPFKGSSDATIVIQEFTDFECPACAMAVGKIENIVKTYPNVRVEFRNFPLVQIHKYAYDAAVASLCANDQGKFWEYHTLLFSNQQKLSKENLLAYAKTTGLDMNNFSLCFDAKIHYKTVQNDMKEGVALGLEGTPSFVLDGKVYWQEELEDAIRAKLGPVAGQ
jgi:protein-disulfide isomerase